MFDVMALLDAAYLGEAIGLIAGGTIFYSGWPALKVQLKTLGLARLKNELDAFFWDLEICFGCPPRC